MPGGRLTPGPNRKLMRTECLQCRKMFRWTLHKCPRCLFPNEKRPAMLACKVFAFVVICAAIWLTVRFLVSAGDREAGVIEPTPDQNSPIKRLFATPEPTPPPGPRFAP